MTDLQYDSDVGGALGQKQDVKLIGAGNKLNSS